MDTICEAYASPTTTPLSSPVRSNVAVQADLSQIETIVIDDDTSDGSEVLSVSSYDSGRTSRSLIFFVFSLIFYS